jgi:putative ABC transport system ATP-binding protein
VEYLDVRENLRLPFRINAALPMDRADGLEALAESLGIAAQLDKYPGELSQGEKQRVAIGRALLPGPQLVLADEPTGNLDPDNTQRIMDLLLEQADDATVVMVTHDHSLVERFDSVMDFEEFQK